MSEIDKLYFKTLEEVESQRFDYIIIGGGAYGTSFARRILTQDKKATVLIMDKGNYLIPEHIQNLPPAYINLNTTVGVRPWVLEGDINFMPQIPYVGGRALFWNAWVPQPDRHELPDWPAASIDRLKGSWYEAGQYMGRRYSLATPGNDNVKLTKLMRDRLFAGLAQIDGALPQGDPRALDSAMATGQGVEPQQWAKFSPVEILIADTQTHQGRLSVVANAEILKLIEREGEISAVETVQGTLAVNGAQVLLACNTLEAAFIGARSFPENQLVGKNLCGHLRSWLAVRVPVASVPALTEQLQACAFYLPGEGKTGRLMHTHISVIHNPDPARAERLLYQILPDASTPQAVATYNDPEYVVIMLHTMGEFLGQRSAESWNVAGAYEDGQAFVRVKMQPADQAFWTEMDTATFQVAKVLAGDAPVQYQQADGSWADAPPASIHNSGLVHEAGTFWMGEDPATSVTDSTGKVHGIKNLYGSGSMLFPRPGSFNPTLTGVTQMFALADELSLKRRCNQ